MIRRCMAGDWPSIRRLHIRLTLELPPVVDVELNKVLATPDSYWQDYARACAESTDQALFVAELDEHAVPQGAERCVGMGHVRVHGAEATLDMLYVDGDHRREGIGSALAAAQEGWAFTSGATTATCHIPETSAARQAAEKRGWHKTEEVFYTEHGFKEHKWTRASS